MDESANGNSHSGLFEISLGATNFVDESWPLLYYRAMTTPAHRLLYDDLSEDEITPGSRELQQQNIADKMPTHFDDKYLRQAEERGINHRLTDEERAEIEQEIAENGWNSLCRCTQMDFKDADIQTRNYKAVMVNLYFEYGGNWAKVFKDSRSCSRRAMAVYWRDPLFQSYIEALDPILMLEARGVVCRVMSESQDDKAALAAALRFLEAKEPKVWDRGVRKQIVANKGSIESALFSRVISDDEVLNTFIKDRLNKLPDNVRSALAESLNQPIEVAPVIPVDHVGGISSQIQVADVTKLKDPFGDYEDDGTDGESGTSRRISPEEV